MERFGEKFDSARFHGTHGHWDVGITGHENNGDLSITAGQFLLQIKTADTRQLYIKHQTLGGFPRPVGQKLLCRGKCLYLQACGAEQITQAFPDRSLVVNHTDKWVVLIHGFASMTNLSAVAGSRLTNLSELYQSHGAVRLRKMVCAKTPPRQLQGLGFAERHLRAR